MVRILEAQKRDDMSASREEEDAMMKGYLETAADSVYSLRYAPYAPHAPYAPLGTRGPGAAAGS